MPLVPRILRNPFVAVDQRRKASFRFVTLPSATVEGVSVSLSPAGEIFKSYHRPSIGTISATG